MTKFTFSLHTNARTTNKGRIDYIFELTELQFSFDFKELRLIFVRKFEKILNFSIILRIQTHI